ncbi:MAG: LpxI family protein [Phycisphaerales bacterium]
MSGSADAAAPRIGLIAGHGQLPILVARGMQAAGYSVHAAGLRGEFAPELAEACTELTPVGIARMGSWIRVMRRAGVSEAVMVGGVAKRRAHARFRVIRLIPDVRSALIWYRRLRHDRRNAALLAAVADEMASAGITLIDSTTHIQDHMAAVGVMGAVAPSTAQRGDIDFGRPILAGSASLDIGQSIAVSNRDVIAVEAVEGTAAMIQRAGELCRAGGWTLMKTSKPDHDMRADVPTVGVETIRQLAEAGAGCLALGAGRVIMIDRAAVIAEADARKIALVGVATAAAATEE